MSKKDVQELFQSKMSYAKIECDDLLYKKNPDIIKDIKSFICFLSKYLCKSLYDNIISNHSQFYGSYPKSEILNDHFMYCIDRLNDKEFVESLYNSKNNCYYSLVKIRTELESGIYYFLNDYNNLRSVDLSIDIYICLLLLSDHVIKKVCK